MLREPSNLISGAERAVEPVDLPQWRRNEAGSRARERGVVHIRLTQPFMMMVYQIFSPSTGNVRPGRRTRGPSGVILSTSTTSPEGSARSTIIAGSRSDTCRKTATPSRICGGSSVSWGPCSENCWPPLDGLPSVAGGDQPVAESARAEASCHPSPEGWRADDGCIDRSLVPPADPSLPLSWGGRSSWFLHCRVWGSERRFYLL